MDKLLFRVLSSAVMVQVAVSASTPGGLYKPSVCGNLTCSFHSACRNHTGVFYCRCSGGFRGETCNEDLDECNVGSPCGHRGVCHNTIGSYWCDCLDGWNGSTHCDQNITDVRQCMPGWSGAWCQDQCYDNSGCSPTSYCKLLHSGTYRCVCKSGWTGKNCTDDIDECRYSPCRHSGTCVNTVGSYTCACANGWTGSMCDEIDVCFHGTPCGDASTCIMTNHTYQCLCADGWEGVNCTEDVDECEINKCVHVESCSNSIGSYSCNCTDGWQGDDCDEPINEGNSGSSSVGIIAWTTVGALFVILTVAFAVVCMFKRKPNTINSVSDRKKSLNEEVKAVQ